MPQTFANREQENSAYRARLATAENENSALRAALKLWMGAFKHWGHHPEHSTTFDQAWGATHNLLK